MFLICVLPATALSTEISRLGLHGLVSMNSRHVLEIMPSELIPRLVEGIAVCSWYSYKMCLLTIFRLPWENRQSTVF